MGRKPSSSATAASCFALLEEANAFARFEGEDLSPAIDDRANRRTSASVAAVLISASPDPEVKPRLIATGNPAASEASGYSKRHQPPHPGNRSTANCSITRWWLHIPQFDNSFLDVDQYVATLKASANNDPAKILAEVWGDWSTTPASFSATVLPNPAAKCLGSVNSCGTSKASPPKTSGSAWIS